MARPGFGFSAKGSLWGLRDPLQAEHDHAVPSCQQEHRWQSATLPGLHAEIQLESRATISSRAWAQLCLGTMEWCSKLSRSAVGDACWALPS